MDGLFIASVFIGIPAVLGSIYRSHLAHQRYMRMLQLRAEMSARLLDRLGTDPSVLEFLKSEVQQQMFDVNLPELAPRMPTPYGRMLAFIQIGVVALSAGVAFLAIRPFSREYSQQDLLMMGALGVAVGLGAILSSIAGLAMSRMWQSMEERKA